MRPVQYQAKDILELFRTRRVATMEELKQVLGGAGDATVFRKLAELSYRSSYSHRGRYYTLDEIPKYDEWGLWAFRDIWFSSRGTLMNTVEALIEGSDAGFFAAELEPLLHVEVKACLVKLVRADRIARERVGGRYLYTSAKATRGRAQRRAREGQPEAPPVSPEVLPDELRAAIVLFASLLDEKQRRLYAGLESLKLGHGGDRRIAELLGLDVGTVARGRRELLSQDVEHERTRRAGGGRRPLEKKRRKS